MIFLQILLIISTLVANISCSTLEQFKQEMEEKFTNLQKKNSQLETTVNLLKNTVDENQATIQVLKEEVKAQYIYQDSKLFVPGFFAELVETGLLVVWAELHHPAQD